VLDSAPAQALLGAPAAQRLGLPPAEDPPSRQRQAVLAALNGVLGDHLHDTGNPLALSMVLRHQGRVVDLADLSAFHAARPRVLLMVHGLCMSPWQWHPQPANGRALHAAEGPVDLGAALAADGDLTLLHLHYNTGLPIAINGRHLADRLQALARAWPVSLQDLVVVGHSMGGLVARSACHVAQTRGDAWLQRLTSLVCLGTPHHGAPLERGGRGLDLLLGVSPYTAAFARLGQVRSAGITDLRHGSVRQADVAGVEAPRTPQPTAADARKPTPLPAHVRCFAVAGQVSKGPLSSRLGAHGQAWLGDGLVPVDSALGLHPEQRHCLDFPPAQRWIAQDLDHFQLMHGPEVLAQLRRWQVVAPQPTPLSLRHGG
jgi:hypothetical protein